MSVFFCNWENWVELFLELSNFFRQLQYQRSDCDVDLQFLEKMNVWYFAASFQGKITFMRFLLCVAKFTKASMEVDTKWRGLGSQKNLGSCIKSDNIDAEIGMCFPIRVVVLVPLKFSCSSQIDLKSKLAMILKSLWLFVSGIPNQSNFSNIVLRSWYTFFGYTCSTVSMSAVRWRWNLVLCRRKYH